MISATGAAFPLQSVAPAHDSEPPRQRLAVIVWRVPFRLDPLILRPATSPHEGHQEPPTASDSALIGEPIRQAPVYSMSRYERFRP